MHYYINDSEERVKINVNVEKEIEHGKKPECLGNYFYGRAVHVNQYKKYQTSSK